MADYFDEMGWRPLGEGEQPDHLLHLARLLRDYNMFEELGQPRQLPPPASKEIVEGLLNVKKAGTVFGIKACFITELNFVLQLAPNVLFV